MSKVAPQTWLVLLFHCPVEERLSNAVLPIDLVICEASPDDAEEAIAVYLGAIREVHRMSLWKGAYGLPQLLGEFLLPSCLVEPGQVYLLKVCPGEVIGCLLGPLPFG